MVIITKSGFEIGGLPNLEFLTDPNKIRLNAHTPITYLGTRWTAAAGKIRSLDHLLDAAALANWMRNNLHNDIDSNMVGFPLAFYLWLASLGMGPIHFISLPPAVKTYMDIICLIVKKEYDFGPFGCLNLTHHEPPSKNNPGTFLILFPEV